MTTHPNETPEPLAQGQAGEMPVVAYLLEGGRTWKARALSTIEHELAEKEAQMRNDGSFASALVRLSDATAALKAKDAEIAGLKSALTVAVDHIEMESLRVSHCKDAALIDAAMKGEAA